MRSFGHAFFIQGGDNTYFEECYAEGEIRPTDQMLAESSGPAFENDFASVYRTYQGKKTIPSGYMTRGGRRSADRASTRRPGKESRRSWLRP